MPTDPNSLQGLGPLRFLRRGAVGAASVCAGASMNCSFGEAMLRGAPGISPGRNGSILIESTRGMLGGGPIAAAGRLASTLPPARAMARTV